MTQLSQSDSRDDYPEHFKLARVQEQSQACGEFLEWLNQQGIELCRHDPESSHGRMFPIFESTTALLADFFEIDLTRLEAEKRAMLDGLRTPR